MSIAKKLFNTNLKLRSKLLFLTVFLVLIAVVTGGSGLFFITNVSTAINNLSEISSPLVRETVKMVKSMDDTQARVSTQFESAATIDVQEVSRLLQNFDKASEQSLSVLVKLVQQNGEQLERLFRILCQRKNTRSIRSQIECSIKPAFKEDGQLR